MPKLTQQDWKKLKDEYKVAFSTMPADLFNKLLDKVYTSANPGELDDIDALMIYLARTEPPIQPEPTPK